MAETAARRTPRRSKPVDPQLFTGEIEAALTAFRHDVSYAVSIARSAVTIANKRQVWQQRREQREAQALADL